MRIFQLATIAFVVRLGSAGCKSPPKLEQANSASASVQHQSHSPLPILFLGDSYTKGEGIPASQSFPAQLVATFAATTEIRATTIAQTGWRSDQLLVAAQQQLRSIGNQPPPFAAVLIAIGVNDQFQGNPIDEFLPKLGELYELALAQVGQRRERIALLSIPDWIATPAGAEYASDPRAARNSLESYNQAIRDFAAKHQLRWFDVTTISRQPRNAEPWVAADGLHPAAAQHTAWVSVISPWVDEIARAN